MFIRKKKLQALLTEYHLKGLTTGYQLGLQMGRMQAGDPGIIVSGKVQWEMEEILRKKGVNDG